MLGCSQGSFTDCLPDGSCQQVTNLCHAAANNHGARIEQVDQPGNRNPNKGAGTLDDLLSGQISTTGRLGNIARAKQVDILLRKQRPSAGSGQLSSLSRDGVPACEGLQASVVAACAQRTVLIDGQMSNLAGRAGGAAVDLLVDNQSCANTASHLDEGQVPLPSPCAIGPFPERTQLRIV